VENFSAIDLSWTSVIIKSIGAGGGGIKFVVRDDLN
jgi:hypothetical protein